MGILQQRIKQHLARVALFTSFVLPAWAGEPVICPQLANLVGQAIAYDGQETYGVVCTDVIEPEFVLFDTGGSILRDPTVLPDIPKGRNPVFKTTHVGEGWVVIGRWIDPQLEGKNISTGNTFVHFHYWEIDKDGKVLQSHALELLAPDSYLNTQNMTATKPTIKA